MSTGAGATDRVVAALRAAGVEPDIHEFPQGTRTSQDGALAGGTLEKADAGFVREHTGFAIGGVPAVAHARPITVLVDRDLTAFETVWSAAGTPNAVYPIAFSDLVALTGGQIADVAQA